MCSDRTAIAYRNLAVRVGTNIRDGVSMSTTLFSRLLYDILAAAMLVCSIVGVFYLAAHHRVRYVAPLLILAGVAFCSLVLDVTSRPLILVQIGAEATVFAIVAGLLLIVLGDIGLWRLLATPPTSLPSGDFYALLLLSVSLPGMLFILMHEADYPTGFVLFAELALVFAGMLVPVLMTFLQIMRAKRAAKRARTIP
jgi:hypothetical protein